VKNGFVWRKREDGLRVVVAGGLVIELLQGFMSGIIEQTFDFVKSRVLLLRASVAKPDSPNSHGRPATHCFAHLL
jgi:hypothetical protein